MSKTGWKHDKRQWLLSHLKRMLRTGWFFRLVVTVVWRIVDHFTR